MMVHVAVLQSQSQKNQTASICQQMFACTQCVPLASPVDMHATHRIPPPGKYIRAQSAPALPSQIQRFSTDSWQTYPQQMSYINDSLSICQYKRCCTTHSDAKWAPCLLLIQCHAPQPMTVPLGWFVSHVPPHMNMKVSSVAECR